MATEFSQLEDEDQEVVCAALEAALNSLRTNGANVADVDHCALLDALVDVFEQATA